jgi:hypothetical protein
LELIDCRYAYDAARIGEEEGSEGATVIGVGRIFLAVRDSKGRDLTFKGRFIRAYEYTREGWALALDFANVPMSLSSE